MEVIQEITSEEGMGLCRKRRRSDSTKAPMVGGTVLGLHCAIKHWTKSRVRG